MLLLAEAARQAGVSKSTLWRAVKAGRVSAHRQDDGSYLIDPAELARVYPAAIARNDARNVAVKRPETIQEAPLEMALRREIDLLRSTVEDLRGERDRLLGVVEEQARSMRLLTDQRVPTELQASTEPPRRPGAARRLLARLFGG